MSPDACLVCDKHAAADPRVEVMRTRLVCVGHHPATPDAYAGHLFVEPLRHAPGLADLTVEEAAAVGVEVSAAARALRALGAEHAYAFVLGDSVPHLHVHVVARWPGTPREFRGQQVTEWPDARRLGADGVAELVEGLRGAGLTAS